MIISFSGRGLLTSYSGEFGENLCGFCRQTALSPFSIVPQKSECRKKGSKRMMGFGEEGKNFSSKFFPSSLITNQSLCGIELFFFPFFFFTSVCRGFDKSCSASARMGSK